MNDVSVQPEGYYSYSWWYGMRNHQGRFTAELRERPMKSMGKRMICHKYREMTCVYDWYLLSQSEKDSFCFEFLKGAVVSDGSVVRHGGLSEDFSIMKTGSHRTIVCHLFFFLQVGSDILRLKILCQTLHSEWSCRYAKGMPCSW